LEAQQHQTDDSEPQALLSSFVTAEAPLSTGAVSASIRISSAQNNHRAVHSTYDRSGAEPVVTSNFLVSGHKVKKARQPIDAPDEWSTVEPLWYSVTVGTSDIMSMIKTTHEHTDKDAVINLDKI
jgi:hypothetical protein